MIGKLWRELIAGGESPRNALALVREVMLRVPWEPDGILRISQEADRWSSRRLATDVGAAARKPDVKATLLVPTNVVQYAPTDLSEPVVRKDAADSVTINGTQFYGRRKEREVVLVDMEKLEAAFKGAQGYQRPGAHDAKALGYGDLLDLNKPATMLRMTDPSDFTQAAKIAALRDRGYKVVPVEVPPAQKKAMESAYGAPVPTKAAVRAKAGERMIDARSWAEGIIGRGRAIERTLLQSVDEGIEHGLRRGQSNKDIEAALRRNFGMAEARARFVARDRLGSLNAQITQQKHERLGFQFYRWASAKDERVRPEHRALEGKIRSWSHPHPTEGHPGEAPNCRCVAIPATVDEYNEQQRRQRRPRAIAVAAGVGVGIVALGVLATRVRPQRLPSAPTVEPIRPLQPTQPLRPIEFPDPANLPMVLRRTVIGRAFEFAASVQRRAAILNRSLFNYAHAVTQTIRATEKRTGEEVSNYAATFQLAIKAIRESKTNAELRERLAALVGWGKVHAMPRKQRLLTGPVEQPKPKKGES